MFWQTNVRLMICAVCSNDNDAFADMYIMMTKKGHIGDDNNNNSNNKNTNNSRSKYTILRFGADTIPITHMKNTRQGGTK